MLRITVSQVNQKFIKELNKGKSEGIKALQVKYNQLQVEIEDCIEELKDLEDIFTDYCEDMTAILPPINRNELMHVGKADVKANLNSIDSAYRSAEVLKTMTSLQDSPGFWLSEEEKEEEKRKMRNNYQKMEAIRTVDIVNLVSELNTKKTELWSLYNNKISAFEDKDDEYRTKANKLYKKYTNTVEYVKEKGKWLVWDLPVEFDKGVLSNLGNTIKGLVIDPYVKSVTVKAALFDWVKAEITGAEDSLGEQYIKNEIETGKMLLKDPFLIVEGIAQESSDTVENKGIAYAGGYAVTEVAKAILLKRIASGEISLGAGSKGAGLVDEIIEGGNNATLKSGINQFKPYSGVKQASDYLKSQGVPRNVRKQVLESFDVRTIYMDVADNNTYGIRFHDFGKNAFPKGRYLYETFQPLSTREGAAIKWEWNKMTGLKQWKVEVDTVVLKGKAAYQIENGIRYEGGIEQWWIKDINKIVEP